MFKCAFGAVKLVLFMFLLCHRVYLLIVNCLFCIDIWPFKTDFYRLFLCRAVTLLLERVGVDPANTFNLSQVSSLWFSGCRLLYLIFVFFNCFVYKCWVFSSKLLKAVAYFNNSWSWVESCLIGNFFSLAISYQA